MCLPAEHAQLFELGTQAVKQGDLSAATTYMRRAHAADPTHAATVQILQRLEQLEPVDADEAVIECCHAIGDGTLSLRTVAAASDVSGATAGVGVWASAPELITWLSEAPEAPIEGAMTTRRELYADKAVLELGSGTGYVGIALATLGASRVCLTDLPQKLPLLKRSLEANPDIAGEMDARILAWGTTGDAYVDGSSFDLLVASDVTYDADLVPPLAHSLASLMKCSYDAGRSPQALLALPQRSHFRPPVTVDGRVLPDSALLFQLLRQPGLGSYSTRRLATIACEPFPVEVWLVE